MSEDIANMITFLCDNEMAGFITGQTIAVDGGSTLTNAGYNNPRLAQVMKQWNW